MSCVVYREGKGHFEHGIECEAARVDIDQLEAHLNSGWSVNPPGYVTEAVEEEAAEVIQPGHEERSVSEEFVHDLLLGPDHSDDVRAAAKAAGIEGWDTKRIKTLKAALAELE